MSKVEGMKRPAAAASNGAVVAASSEPHKRVKHADDEEEALAADVAEAGGQLQVDASSDKSSLSFAALGLNSVLCEACAAVGYTQPTLIQAQAIPHALQGVLPLSWIFFKPRRIESAHVDMDECAR